jgi:hypothetical protein
MKGALRLSDKQASSQCTRKFTKTKSSLYRRSRREHPRVKSAAFIKKKK